jgi:uncharacterized protein (DUF1778 family)
MTSTQEVKTLAMAQDRLDQVRFTMDKEQMQRFAALLDAPPVAKPKLAKLMSTPSPWEQKTVQR